MDNICMFTEIHPYGLRAMENVSNPVSSVNQSFLYQAKHWHGLLDYSDREELYYPEDQLDRFIEDIQKAYEAATKQGKHIVIRDWATIDYLGQFFDEQKREDVFKSIIPEEWQTVHLNFIRHPIQQFTSMVNVEMLKELNPEVFFEAYFKFLFSNRFYQCLRYEDFCQNPHNVLEAASNILQIPFDKEWKEKWAGETKVTGDPKARGTEASFIQENPFSNFHENFLKVVESSENYWKILNATGYKHVR